MTSASVVQKRQREEWFALVDEIARDDGLVDLSDVTEEATAMKLDRFLPRAISEGARRYVASKVKDPEVAGCSSVFQPQMTYLEAMRALPVVGSTEADYERQKSRRQNELASNMTTSLQPLLNSDMEQQAESKPKHEGFSSGPFFQWAKKAGTLAPDFMPIIFAPSEPTAPLQICNVRSFLEEGKFHDPTEVYIDSEGSANRLDKPDYVIVEPGSFLPAAGRVRTAFRKFRVVDDPKQISDWSHVCACIVTGKTWQFDKWFPNDVKKKDPSRLFHSVRGFLPYFEEDKVPPALKEWYVCPIVLNRKLTRANATIRQAQNFWEELYKFLDAHPRFRHYTIPLPEN